jgi:uncharacterized protein YndB with AHSA1/START domain
MTTDTQTATTEVTVDKDLPIIRTTREFNASPDKVFRAHTEEALLAKWLGPRALTTRFDRFECRSGGSYRYVQEMGGTEFGFYGSYHEIRPSSLIVQTTTFEGFPDAVSLERLAFEDLGNGRTRLTTTILVDSFETRDAMVASGMEQGVSEGYEKLDELLTQADTKTEG